MFIHKNGLRPYPQSEIQTIKSPPGTRDRDQKGVPRISAVFCRLSLDFCDPAASS
jgi:hypothetical protein